jgi:hypothetical protein
LFTDESNGLGEGTGAGTEGAFDDEQANEQKTLLLSSYCESR